MKLHYAFRTDSELVKPRRVHIAVSRLPGPPLQVLICLHRRIVTLALRPHHCKYLLVAPALQGLSYIG